MNRSTPQPADAPPVIITGAGGHARVLLDVLHLLGRHVLCFTDSDAGKHGTRHGGVEVRGDHALILDYPADTVELVNGVGSVGQPAARRALYERFVGRGYRFPAVVHPRAVVAESAELADGVQVMAGAVVQPGCVVGVNAILNTRCSVDHDCRVGVHSHIAPGATLSGGVTVGAGCLVGAGAVVIQGVRIGDGAVVGAGAAVVRGVPAGAVVVGVPAREVRSRR